MIPVYLTRTQAMEMIWESFPIIVIDLNSGNILAASRNAEILFGYKVRGELCGLCVEDLIPQHLRQRHIEHRKRFSENPQTRTMGAGMELQGLAKDEDTFPVRIMLTDASMIAGQCCAAAVITDMRHA